MVLFRSWSSSRIAPVVADYNKRVIDDGNQGGRKATLLELVCSFSRQNDTNTELRQVRQFSDRTPKGKLNYRLGNSSGSVCSKLEHALLAIREDFKAGIMREY